MREGYICYFTKLGVLERLKRRKLSRRGWITLRIQIISPIDGPFIEYDADTYKQALHGRGKHIGNAINSSEIFFDGNPGTSPTSAGIYLNGLRAPTKLNNVKRE